MCSETRPRNNFLSTYLKPEAPPDDMEGFCLLGVIMERRPSPGSTSWIRNDNCPLVSDPSSATLEDEPGFTLLNRSTRHMQMTPGGKAYYEGCKRILAEITELKESLTSAYHTSPSGVVGISAPDGLGSPFLVEAIKAFRAHYPDILFDLDLSSTPFDLPDPRIDLSIRLAFELVDSSMIASRLGATSFSLYASAEYLDDRGYPSDLKELENHDCIHLGGSRYCNYWNILENDNIVRYKQPWTLVLPSTDSLIHSVAEGMGIAMIPNLLADMHLESPKLVELKGVARFPQLGVYALYPTRRHLPYRVTLFLDFLKQRAGDKLRG